MISIPVTHTSPETIQLLTRIVGHVAPKNPQASLSEKIKHFFAGFKSLGTDSQLAMRQHFINLSHDASLNRSGLSDKTIVLVKSFSTAVKLVDPSITDEKIVSLFQTTMTVLAAAERKPALPVSERDVQLFKDWANEALGIKPEVTPVQTHFPFKRAALVTVGIATLAAVTFGALSMLGASSDLTPNSSNSTIFQSIREAIPALSENSTSGLRTTSFPSIQYPVNGSLGFMEDRFGKCYRTPEPRSSLPAFLGNHGSLQRLTLSINPSDGKRSPLLAGSLNDSMPDTGNPVFERFSGLPETAQAVIPTSANRVSAQPISLSNLVCPLNGSLNTTLETCPLRKEPLYIVNPDTMRKYIEIAVNMTSSVLQGTYSGMQMSWNGAKIGYAWAEPKVGQLIEGASYGGGVVWEGAKSSWSHIQSVASSGQKTALAVGDTIAANSVFRFVASGFKAVARDPVGYTVGAVGLLGAGALLKHVSKKSFWSRSQQISTPSQARRVGITPLKTQSVEKK